MVLIDISILANIHVKSIKNGKTNNTINELIQHTTPININIIIVRYALSLVVFIADVFFIALMDIKINITVPNN